MVIKINQLDSGRKSFYEGGNRGNDFNDWMMAKSDWVIQKNNGLTGKSDWMVEETIAEMIRTIG